MEELDLTDKQLNEAMQAAYNENPNVGYFDTGFRKGFLFAKKIAIAAINKTSEEQNDISPLVSESVCYTKDCCQHSMFKELCLSDNARKTCKKQTVR